MKRKLCALILALALLTLCFPTALAADMQAFPRNRSYKPGMFSDVSAGAWYENSVRTAYELGLMQGNADGTFNPEGNLRVVEAIVTFCRIHSIYLQDGADFTPKAGETWYQPYLDYANSTRLIYIGPISAGLPEWEPTEDMYVVYETEAELMEDISRIDYALTLSIALPPEALPEINTVVYGAIPDVMLDDFGTDAVYMLYRSGILNGNDAKGTFTPDALIQRAAAAAIISRLADPALRLHTTLDKVDFTPIPMKQLAHYSSMSKRMSEAEYKEAYDTAVELVAPLSKLSTEYQLYTLTILLRSITEGSITYSTTEPHYNDPYGFFVKNIASCAGCTRATGLCLDILGIPYEHVNENAYTHQWCRVQVGDEYWIVDAFGFYAGPEEAPYEHPYGSLWD